MSAAARPARTAAVLGLVALTACWVLVVVGSYLQPGYDSGRDRISPIAAHGARAPYVGITAIVLLALAYLAASVVLRDGVGSRLGAGLMTVAAAATVVVAFARLDCPAGSTGCARNEGGNRLVGPAADDTEGLIHSGAVIVAYGFVAATMLVLALLWWRGGRRVRAALSAGALVTSLATVPFWTVGEHPGAVQRLWLGILTGWVVLVLVQPLIGGRGTEEAQA